MEDPFFGENENAALLLSREDYTYRKSFSIPASLTEQDRVELFCEGLDTLAEVRIHTECRSRGRRLRRGCG